MSAQRTNFRSWDEELAHREHRQALLLKVQGLQSLLDEWQTAPHKATQSKDYRDYLQHLRERLRTARNNYEAMQP